MLISKLVTEFSTRVHLPVDVNDVVSFFVSNGIQDDIEFIGVDLDEQILLGSIKRFRRRDGLYGDVVNCANIYYDRAATPDWKRFITCKELIHLADPKWAQSLDADAIMKLLTKIGLPPGMQDAANDGLNTNFDRVAEYVALAVLFPWDARSVLQAPFKSGNINLDDIARLADIPKKYASLAMHESWDRTVEVLRQIKIDD